MMKITPLMSTKTAIVIVTLSFITILTAFTLNIFYRKSLFNLSLQMIYTMQSQTQSTFLNIFHNIVTIYAGTEGTFVLMVLTYVLSYNKIKAIVLIMYICLNVYIMAFLKVIFIDPRPYVYTNLVQNLEWKCEITYGFPSGHTWILLLLHEPAVTDFLGCGPFKIRLMYCVVLAGLVTWSRMYLGSHTADQLVNGLLYSFAFLVIYRYFLRRRLYQLIGFMLNPRKRRIKFLILVFIHVMILIPPIILYQINMVYRDVDMWEFDMTNKVSHKNLTYEHKMGAQISDIAIGNILMGFMYGFLLLQQFYGNQQAQIPTLGFLLGNWQFKKSKINIFMIMKFLMYVLSILLTSGTIYIMIGLFINEFYFTYLLKVLGWNFMIIIWITIIPEIAVRYQLIIPTHTHKNEFAPINNPINN